MGAVLGIGTPHRTEPLDDVDAVQRYVALAKATSFRAVPVATYAKHGTDQPTGVQTVGPIHGALCIAYVLLALNLRVVGQLGAAGRRWRCCSEPWSRSGATFSIAG